MDNIMLQFLTNKPNVVYISMWLKGSHAHAKGDPIFLCVCVATPLLEECEDDTHIPKMGTWESSGTPKTSEFNCRVKTPRLEAFSMSSEIYWSVDVENGLAWAIWTSVAQVMAKRSAESQTGSLTPDY
jgi:hypothetical protein